jgi:hypothetical protein
LPHKDPEVRKAYQKAYRKSHKEKAKINQHIYYLEHKEQNNAQSKAYRESHKEERKIYDKLYWEKNKKKRLSQVKSWQKAHSHEIICLQCGGLAKVYKGKFCSKKCQLDWQKGPNHPTWRGGTSFHKYCHKFNEPFKREIRDKFGGKCFLSGKTKIENKNKELDVHHCDYSKSQGCRGQRWSLLTLTHSLHCKTNYNRWYWFGLLRDYWCYKYLTFHGMDIFEGPSRTEWLWEIYNVGGLFG